ncbi:hypothetical protein BD626DRAFT_570376 [Schizophyllum amplum]|uniref:Uncharacterized protein n=1 Tax=Schizophyllum amplum TaxID=97359 RepID=A0A550CBH3_9AGAR|nr:hypothetical protein BD626DRAFT_570376 [Auriculariopsis ampla]
MTAFWPETLPAANGAAPQLDFDEFCVVYIRTNGGKKKTVGDIDMSVVESVKRILGEQNPPMWYRAF